MLNGVPMPSWDAMHPLLIHFPIVLLLLAPLFVVMSAAVRSPRNRPYMTVALITLFLGTGSLFLSASSGEEAAELADRAGGVNAVLSAHEALASTCEVLFAVFSAIFAGLYIWQHLRRHLETRVISTVAPLVFVALYSVGIVYLVNTAHAGGRLVHEFGVHAMMPQAAAQESSSGTAAAPEHRQGD